MQSDCRAAFLSVAIGHKSEHAGGITDTDLGVSG